MRPRVVILCGGRGARLSERSGSGAKPMVAIGGRPILWHVIHIFLAQGFRRFLLLTGHGAEQVSRFAEDEPWPAGVTLACLDTGPDTPTGGRLHRAAVELAGERDFCLAYADGVADIDLEALVARHRAHREQGAVATMAVVRPRLPFGVARLDGGDLVRDFAEKPRSEQWVNGGFFCLEPSVLELVGPDSVLEGEPLERLAAEGRLRAYRHEGFWGCLDTYKDRAALEELWSSGRAPWKRWA